MAVIDANYLLLMFRPGTQAPAGPGGIRIERPKERIEFLIDGLNKAKSKIIVPTPALSELLVRAGASASQQIIEKMQKYSVFRIEPFDTRAAIEVAAMSRKALDSGKKKGSSVATYAKVKYDRQIVAIARVCGARTIYSDDGDIATLAKETGIVVVKLIDLPLPPKDAQLDIFKDGGNGS